MLRSVFILGLLISFFKMNAQLGLGANLGMAPTVFNTSGNNDIIVYSENTLHISGYLVTTIPKKINYGLFAYREQYEITIAGYSNESTRFGYIHDDHKSTFLYLAPFSEISFGKNNGWHFLLLPSVGFKIKGMDSAEIKYSYYSGKAFYDTTFNSGENIRNIIFRLGFQVQNRISLNKRNFLVISAGYSFMFGGLTSSISGFGEVHPRVFTLSFGYMRDFKKTKLAVPSTTTSTTPQS